MTNPPIPLHPRPPDEPECHAPGGRCIGRGCRGSAMLGCRNDVCPFAAPADEEADDSSSTPPWPLWLRVLLAIALGIFFVLTGVASIFLQLF